MSKQIQLNDTFKEAVPVLMQLKEKGYEAYFVGGSVRDALLGKEIHDVDIASSAFPEEVKSLFRRTVDVGIQHGTVMVLVDDDSYEITTFRTESTYQDYRRPDKVTFVRSLEEDLKRRDFTINALAMDETGRVVDFFNGLEDLSAGLIRAVGEPSERFNEDALRMMRAVRFQSQLDFRLDRRTFEAISRHHALLGNISVERINVEFSKLMLGKGFKKGLKSLIDSNLYCYCPQLADHKQALEQFASLDRPVETETQMWALLLHFMDFPVEKTESFMRSWKCSKNEMSRVKKALKGLKERLDRQPTYRYIYEMGLEIAEEVEQILELLGRQSQLDAVRTLHSQLPIRHRGELAVSGNEVMSHLDKKPGKWLGEVLEKLESAVVEKNIENDKQVLLQSAKLWAENE